MLPTRTGRVRTPADGRPTRAGAQPGTAHRLLEPAQEGRGRAPPRGRAQEDLVGASRSDGHAPSRRFVATNSFAGVSRRSSRPASIPSAHSGKSCPALNTLRMSTLIESISGTVASRETAVAAAARTNGPTWSGRSSRVDDGVTMVSFGFEVLGLMGGARFGVPRNPVAGAAGRPCETKPTRTRPSSPDRRHPRRTFDPAGRPPDRCPWTADVDPSRPQQR